MTMNQKIDILDKGYVRVEAHMGNDLSVVNSAKTSYDKRSETFAEREARLLAFLIREMHTSTLRHAAVTFEVYAPLMVARQWWKYAVASSHVEDQLGWNESSRRYITEEPTFYIPKAGEWREKPENSKQGSGHAIEERTGAVWTEALNNYVDQGLDLYESLLGQGVAAEQARLFLPAYGMYVRWWWTASLASILHFLHQRLEHDAQFEIQQYARHVKTLTELHFPATIAAMFPEGLDPEK